jgi:hypothetical protein
MLCVAALTWLMAGCSKMTPAQMALNSVSQGNFDKGGRPACEIQQTEYALDGKLISFEVTDSGGAHAGFSLLTGFLKLLSLDFNAASGKLTVGLTLTDPIFPSLQLVNVLGGGRTFSFNANVDAGFQNIGAGFNYMHNTPLASLAESSLDDAFTNLTAEMNAKQSEWKTQVLALPSSTQFVIPAGSYANVKKGDVFAIYNVRHQWEGTPCASKYLMGVETTPTPLAYARADQVENNASLLTMICSDSQPCNTSEKVEIGATVRISQLTDAKRSLARLIKINSIRGATIPYEQSKSVDISPYLNDIVNAVAANYNFLVYKP